MTILKMTGILAFAVCMASCGGSVGPGGPPVLPPPSAPPGIFKSYRDDGNASMAEGWTRGIDMSGVSFNDTRTATLITPRHVVMAKHYARPAAAPVVFHDRNLFVHLVAGVENGTIAFKHDHSERHGWSKNLVVGDSGNPSFLIAGNELVLVETHTTGGPGAGPYYGDPAVQQSMRQAVQKLDPSYRIRTVAIR